MKCKVEFIHVGIIVICGECGFIYELEIGFVWIFSHLYANCWIYSEVLLLCLVYYECTASSCWIAWMKMKLLQAREHDELIEYYETCLFGFILLCDDE